MLDARSADRPLPPRVGRLGVQALVSVRRDEADATLCFTDTGWVPLGREQNAGSERWQVPMFAGIPIVVPRVPGVGCQPRLGSEDVKANETGFGQTFCISAASGSLIHATVGSFGGVGRPANRVGLAA
jgi:hypothetical protein